MSHSFSCFWNFWGNILLVVSLNTEFHSIMFLSFIFLIDVIGTLSCATLF